jgi:hypothetical protein
MTAVSFLALALLEDGQIHPAGDAQVDITVGIRDVHVPMHAMALLLLLGDKIGAICQ